MNTFLNAMTDTYNYGFTENGAIKHNTTKSAVLDMFALCGSYRNRSDEDCILAFKNALEENETLAMKCLFYLRDVRGGQGERRFFRVCFKWLCNANPEAAHRNIINVSEYGRWDDLIYACIGTKMQNQALALIKHQLALDVTCKTPSLLAKWLPSENASSTTTKRMGGIVREYLNMSHKEYRKTLSVLRSRINVLEKLMSENRWEEIEFDKIPSKAGLIYRNAFARRDILAKRYEAFAKDENTTVNAEVLNPVDIAHQAFEGYYMPRDGSRRDDSQRLMLQKYWDNLKDYYNGREENGIAIVDVSGSMRGVPMEAAVSMGAYIAERGHGPFANHFITFSQHPEFVKFEGVDVVDKFNRCRKADWGYDTNIEAVFDLLLYIAKRHDVKPEDIPTRLYIFSDMEFNYGLNVHGEGELGTLLERIANKWRREGYELPQLIFWNLDARSQNIPAITGGRFAYISGFSMSMIESVLSGKDGYDLMLEKLMSDRYATVI